jgi:hypothetical protein
LGPAPDVEEGPGVVVKADVVVEPGVLAKADVVVEPGVLAEHDVPVAAHAFPADVESVACFGNDQLESIEALDYNAVGCHVAGGRSHGLLKDYFPEFYFDAV